MTPSRSLGATGEFERLLEERKEERFVLRLYVSGMTQRSLSSIATLKSLCEQLLPGRYDLEVIDLFEHAEEAQARQILAAPTLIKELPPPLRRLVGDLTRPDRLILVLQ